MTQEHLRENAAEEIRVGQQALEAAKTLLAANLPRDAASRAYYAAFHFARVLYWAAGESPRKHQGVAYLLGVHYVQTGRLPADVARRYGDLQRYRELSDYRASEEIDMNAAQEALALAEGLVEQMGTLLRSLGVLEAD